MNKFVNVEDIIKYINDAVEISFNTHGITTKTLYDSTIVRVLENDLRDDKLFPATSIVRCENCVYGKRRTLSGAVICPRMNMTMEPNDFCSRGITEISTSRAL